MNLSIEHIDFSKISPLAFENVIFEMLRLNGFEELIWRQGGSDSGRDIEGFFQYKNSIASIKSKWCIECKNYKNNGVSPTELNSKIAWADAENPDVLAIFVSTYITNSSRDWLEKIKSKKTYKIVIIEGEELKQKIFQHSDLVERFFAKDRYLKLYTDLRDAYLRYSVLPSHSLMSEVFKNIDLTQLDFLDISFLLLCFYKQRNTFLISEQYAYVEHDLDIAERLIAYLIKNLETTEFYNLQRLVEAKNCEDIVRDGIFSEVLSDGGDEDCSLDYLEGYDYHYASFIEDIKAKNGNYNEFEYLLIIRDDCALEIVQEKQTQIRILREFKPEKIRKTLFFNSKEIVTRFIQYQKNIAIKKEQDGLPF